MKPEGFSLLSHEQRNGVDLVLVFGLEPTTGLTVIDICGYFGADRGYEYVTRMAIGSEDRPLSEAHDKKQLEADLEVAKQHVVRMVESRRRAAELVRNL